jgi:uncharacterized protein YdcH (DUF465 family)
MRRAAAATQTGYNNAIISSVPVDLHQPLQTGKGVDLVSSLAEIHEDYRAEGSAFGGVYIMRIPHELQDEFPQETSLIERLTRTNHHFMQLAKRYDEVNRHIHRIESEEEPTTDEVLERLKKRRLKLKDEVAIILTKLEHRM